MTKKTGINIRLDAFIEIDKTNFAQQRDAFGVLAEIEQTGKLPANFFDLAKIIDLTAKQGTADIPDAPKPVLDPGDVPLTTDPLPEGATILTSTDDLGGTIYQTIRLADGTETGRRISVEQDAAEAMARADAAGGKTKTK